MIAFAQKEGPRHKPAPSSHASAQVISGCDPYDYPGSPALSRMEQDSPANSAVPAIPRTIQAKLVMNQPDDEYEKQADHASEHLMRMPDPGARSVCPCGGGCPKCQAKEAQEGVELVQTKGTGASPTRQTTPPPIVEKTLRSTGRPLDSSIRSFMEPRFGHDFGGVRIHADAEAAESARSIEALAYTSGNHVVFGEGQYAPNSPAGRQLLAHELAHVIRQRNTSSSATVLQRKPKTEPAPTFHGCTSDTALSPKPNEELEVIRRFAADLVDAALLALEKNDDSDEYRAALATHFVAPTFADRKTLHGIFRMIWFHLKPENISCASTKKDRDYCDSSPDGRIMAGFTPTDTHQATLCSSFWSQSFACRAITLIHEAAHGIGVGNGSVHPPYRGTPGYPGLGGLNAGSTTAERMDNPDAFAYFAAQMGRQTDTACVVFVGAPEVIDVSDPAPTLDKK